MCLFVVLFVCSLLCVLVKCDRTFNADTSEIQIIDIIPGGQKHTEQIAYVIIKLFNDDKQINILF